MRCDSFWRAPTTSGAEVNNSIPCVGIRSRARALTIASLHVSNSSPTLGCLVFHTASMQHLISCRLSLPTGSDRQDESYCFCFVLFSPAVGGCPARFACTSLGCCIVAVRFYDACAHQLVRTYARPSVRSQWMGMWRPRAGRIRIGNRANCAR